MKTRVKITDKYLSTLPTSLVDGLDEELKQAEIEPYLKRAGHSGLEIAEGDEMMSIAHMSTRAMDSDMEIIMPYALDISRYSSNPVVLVNHCWSEVPIGSATDIHLHDNGIDGKIKYANTERGNEIWSLVRDGHMRANSIGFIILDYVSRAHVDFTKMVNKALREWPEFTRAQADKLKGFIRRGILLENSIVTIPANPDALMEAVSTRSYSISDGMLKMLKLDKKEQQDGETEEEVATTEESEELDAIIEELATGFSAVDVTDVTEVLPIDEIEVVENEEEVEVEVEEEVVAEVEPEVVEPEVVEPELVVEEPAPEPVVKRLVARLVHRPEPISAPSPDKIARLAKTQLDLRLGRV